MASSHFSERSRTGRETRAFRTTCSHELLVSALLLLSACKQCQTQSTVQNCNNVQLGCEVCRPPRFAPNQTRGFDTQGRPQTLLAFEDGLEVTMSRDPDDSRCTLLCWTTETTSKVPCSRFGFTCCFPGVLIMDVGQGFTSEKDAAPPKYPLDCLGGISMFLFLSTIFLSSVLSSR